ncbi:MAG: glycosyltransferase family 1 protein [Chloroflexi bacterium]|nr:MAG: glycosyltransferase family 1 protein [Chloroflexota bacterium]
MMNIAVNAWFWDNPSVGSGQYLKYLLPALLRADPSLHIHLVSPRPFGDLPPALQPFAGRLHCRTCPTPWPNQHSHLAKVWFEQVTFPRTCRKLGVDLAHVPYFGSPLSPTVPTVVTIHDLIPMVLAEYRGGLRVRLYTSLVAAGASRAALILADSRHSKQDILAKLHLPDEQVRVVYLAPAPHYQPAQTWQEIVEIKKKYNLPENFVLYLGGYDIRKNVAALLYAYTWVSHTLGDEFPLVLGGKMPPRDTPFTPDPRRIARELGIEDFVITPGWFEEEDLPLIYAAAAVFVYPSRYEGFGLPVLEAMACGVPVVTTNAASIPELAGPAAYQIDPDDTKHIAAPIIRLCTDEETRDDLIARGFEQVEKFSWEKTAAETLQAYRDVLSA